jgi:2-hydroxychromene-2-carboxylate isomerase
MGELIHLHAVRGRRIDSRGRRRSATFYFDLSSPFTYLAVEQAERLLGSLNWRPTLAEALHVGSPWPDAGAWEEARGRAEARARELRMPLVWPDRWPFSARAAMRAASYAADQGRASAFVLAASRLAFCGGFDLEDPEVLAEAAAAATLGLDECLRAARDVARDAHMEEAGRRLLAGGAHSLPALRIGRTIFCGDDAMAAAAVAQRGARRAAS